ncbi:hypothetical protein RRG08_050153 [Elysia crispata]|uniref:Uncharacterized protein n=1 Tax=Elysia crispata TaxID=231223 RepID=A0AAE1ACG7_9GAST|nr:hypothetical protein RRG08_050153 [Elysia crispata]
MFLFGPARWLARELSTVSSRQSLRPACTWPRWGPLVDTSAEQPQLVSWPVRAGSSLGHPWVAPIVPDDLPLGDARLEIEKGLLTESNSVLHPDDRKSHAAHAQ